MGEDETQGFFAVDYVGSVRNPAINGVVVLMTANEGGRTAGEMYTYEGNGVWMLVARV